MKGFIHVYTGNGKGKTTAALGLALRAAGAGFKVYIGQFMKKGSYSELESLRKFKNSIKIEQFGRQRFVGRKITREDKVLAQKGLEKVKRAIESGKYKLIILDEINVVLHYGLINESDVIEMLKNRNKQTEVVLTGRNASQAVVKLADLVTEMREVKHYFSKGVKARTGIEK